MKRLRRGLCFLSAILLLFCCCSCGLFGEQRYICEIDKVQSAQIVKLDKYVEGEYRYEYIILSEINDCSTFVAKLNNLKHSVNWGEPGQFDIGYIVIKINYLDGDFDLIYTNAQWFNRAGVNQNGYFFFDEEQFKSLISDYIEESD